MLAQLRGDRVGRLDRVPVLPQQVELDALERPAERVGGGGVGLGQLVEQPAERRLGLRHEPEPVQVSPRLLRRRLSTAAQKSSAVAGAGSCADTRYRRARRRASGSSWLRKGMTCAGVSMVMAPFGGRESVPDRAGQGDKGTSGVAHVCAVPISLSLCLFKRSAPTVR